MTLTLVALLAVAGGVVWASGSSGVYACRATVIVKMASDAGGANRLIREPRFMLDAAGVVGAMMDNTGQGYRFSSQDVPLSGAGVLDGYSVRQQDSGKQWNQDFQRAEVVFEVTGPTEGGVANRMAELLTETSNSLARLQHRMGVDPSNAVVMSHGVPSIVYEHGSRTRTILVSALIGLAFTITLVRLADGRSSPSVNDVNASPGASDGLPPRSGLG